MSYRVTGIRDSAMEGWTQKDYRGPCATARIEVETPLGAILVDVSSDKEHPGVFLSFRKEGEAYERTVALMEQDPAGQVELKVWKDERVSGDYDVRFLVEPALQDKKGGASDEAESE